MKKRNKRKALILLIPTLIIIIGIGCGIVIYQKNSSTHTTKWEREREREREQKPPLPPSQKPNSPTEDKPNSPINPPSSPDNKPNNPPNPNPKPSNDNDKPLFPFNPTEPEPHIPPAPPGISEAEAKDKILNKYYFLSNIARVLEEDLPTLLAQIPYQGDKYPNSTFEEMVARNEAILKQKKIKGFASLSTKSRENYDKFSEMSKEKQRFLFVSLTPRKSDNTVDWKKLLEMIEKEISLLRLDKIAAYIKNKVNPALAEWFEKVPGPGSFPSDPVARLALFNEIVEENVDIELPMKILINMWEDLKAKKFATMGMTYFKLSIESQVMVG